MAQRPRFSLPDGLRMEITPDGLDVEFDGDVELSQDLDAGLHRVVATGDLTVTLHRITGTLRAGGVLTLKGNVEADHLHGKRVVLGDQNIRCTSISADECIEIGAAGLAVDAIIAPEVQIHGQASGRVTVIESDNPRGPTLIKGGFSVSDYNDMFGNADAFLAQRGLRRLGPEGPAPSRTVPPAPQRSAENRPAGPSTSRTSPSPSPEQTQPLPALRDAPPQGLPFDDDQEPTVVKEPAQRRPAPPTVPLDPEEQERRQRLADALHRITSCYQGGEAPPAVEQLRILVESGDTGALKRNITEVWNGLLGYHQKRGIRPHHQVTHAFNLIHGLVQASVP
ncbi:MAG: hypothetical protein KTR31_15670 [Myxococcales bacterium]|nr:hypothetical protein [Myxococcales bacterium]